MPDSPTGCNPLVGRVGDAVVLKQFGAEVVHRLLVGGQVLWPRALANRLERIDVDTGRSRQRLAPGPAAGVS